MRTLYIALIFVGCLSLALGVGPEIIPVRTPAANCANGQATATGCKTCNTTANECTAADTEKGYFLNVTSKQAAACPRACKTCTGPLACTDCQTDGFADPAGGSVKCQNCKVGYAPDNGVENTNTKLDAACISVAEDSPNLCFTGFVWNSLPSLGRQCIAEDADCLTGYTRTTEKMNCDKCDAAKNYVNIKSQAYNGNNLWIWTQQCIKPIELPAARVVKQCTDTNPTDSCETCTGSNVCAKAKPGFFVSTQRLRSLSTEANAAGQVFACPPQCKECDNDKFCKSCDTTLGYLANPDTVSKWCLCDATKGYTPSIVSSNIKLDTPVTYNCVNQALGQSCAALYTWSAPYQLPLTPTTPIPQCVSPIDTQPCYTDTRTNLGDQKDLFSLTSFWNQTVNPKRTCILASTGKCPDLYTTKPAQTNEATTPLTGDCTECVSGATISGTGTDLTCVPNTSSFLVMSLAFLGVLLALVF